MNSQALHKELPQNIPMGFKLVGAALVSAVVILPAAPSQGAETPAPNPIVTSTLTPAEQYKLEKLLYQAELKIYNIAVQRINQNFKIAIDGANLDYRNAVDKFSAKTILRSATAAAIAQRDGEILALGAKPIPPVEPPKVARIAPGKESARPRK